MELGLIQGTFAIAKYALDARPQVIPDQSDGSSALLSVSWTDSECTVVAPEDRVPGGYIERQDGWAVLKIEGVLDFSLIGVLSSVLAPLGKAGVSVFTLSTFSTDYILVKTDSLDSAVASLREAGFVVGLL